MSRGAAIIGAGRAGGSFAAALAVAGWEVTVLHRTDAGNPSSMESAEVVLLCVPDSSVTEVASRITPSGDRVVAHCSGALGLDVLAPAPRRATVHPLASLPDAETGAGRLAGGWFAVSGDRIVKELVESLGGHFVEVDDESRTAYHAAAAIASNHLVALMGQVARVAAQAGVPLDAYRRLANESLNGAFGYTIASSGYICRVTGCKAASGVKRIWLCMTSDGAIGDAVLRNA